MKSILCFGDSNTYGYIAGGLGRYSFDVRWPGRLERLLGPGWRVVEEGLCGRTTVFREPVRPGGAGIDYISPCVASHRPLDFVVLMLGTNDCKAEFHASAKEITAGLRRIVDVVKAETSGAAKILIISPASLGESVWGGSDFGFDARSYHVSLELADRFAELAGERACLFLDAARIVTASGVDFVHLDERAHDLLARAVAGIILREC